MKPDLDIVVVNYKTYPLIQLFIDSYVEFQPETVDTRLIIMDNSSDDELLQGLDISKLVDPIVYGSKENLGYAKACNKGASFGTSKYIALMNSDVVFVNNTCIDICINFLEENPDVGIVGPFQYCEDRGGKRVTHAGIIGPGNRPTQRAWMQTASDQFRENEEVLMVMGAVMIIRREAWDKMRNDEIFKSHYPDALGAMPEHQLYYEDTALCYGMPRLGYKVFYVGEPGAEIVHQWHKTIDSYGDDDNFHISREKFRNLMDDWNIIHD